MCGECYCGEEDTTGIEGRPEGTGKIQAACIQGECHEYLHGVLSSVGLGGWARRNLLH